MTNEVCKRNETNCILDAATRVKKRENQHRQATRHLRTGVAKYTEVDGGTFRHLLGTVTNLSFNTLNAELNPICHFLVLLGAHHILHVSRIRVKR